MAVVSINKRENVLITGGAGFIGSNFTHYLLGRDDFEGQVVVLDKLTYAGNGANLEDIARVWGGKRYTFVHGDIADGVLVQQLLATHAIDTVVHFAAESHVDRSIHSPATFIQTNVVGTQMLLDAVRGVWKDREDVIFYHISTDEVFGSLGEEGYFSETTAYAPRSPYAASKAASDHLVRSYGNTYDLPFIISNCSNNYGPYQFPEKMLPLMLLNALNGRMLPIYGDGHHRRDWLYVKDHCAAIWTILKQGRVGDTYCIGGDTERSNLDTVAVLLELLENEFSSSLQHRTPLRELISFVPDRPGHDERYAMDCTKLKRELGWSPTISLTEGLRETIAWYIDNPDWVAGVSSGAYREGFINCS